MMDKLNDPSQCVCYFEVSLYMMSLCTNMERYLVAFGDLTTSDLGLQTPTHTPTQYIPIPPGYVYIHVHVYAHAFGSKL